MQLAPIKQLVLIKRIYHRYVSELLPVQLCWQKITSLISMFILIKKKRNVYSSPKYLCKKSGISSKII